jgi:hypothetical protein
LKAKQGRSQKGLCFVSEASSIEDGVYQLSYNGRALLTDIRATSSVPDGLAVLDSRIFSWLSCEDEADISLLKIESNLPTCTNIRLTLSSTRDLDNRTIADAISKRVNDLHDDFDGLILQIGQTFQIDRLGIRFTVQSLDPMDSDNQAARITWNNLEKIHLDPVQSLQPFNIVCIVEVGAAAQISDVETEDGPIPRYKAALHAIQHISDTYSVVSSNAQFQGFAYSDEIIPFKMFDPETGSPIEVTSIHASSLFIGFNEWIEALIPNHKKQPSNPGEALRIGLQSAEEIASNSLPTIILFYSSGVHTSGPNPVKTVKSQDSICPILCFVPGEKSSHDLMEAIADISHGKTVIVNRIDEASNILDAIMDLAGGF